MKRRKLSKRKRIKITVRSERRGLPKGPFRDNTGIQLLVTFDTKYLCDCISDVANSRVYPSDPKVTQDKVALILDKIRKRISTELNENLSYDFAFWEECKAIVDGTEK